MPEDCCIGPNVDSYIVLCCFDKPFKINNSFPVLALEQQILNDIAVGVRRDGEQKNKKKKLG